METMYDRVKRMSYEEMRKFIYIVYLCGNEDGKEMMCDSPSFSYFGDGFLHIKVEDLMPNDDVEDLFESWKIK